MLVRLARDDERMIFAEYAKDLGQFLPSVPFGTARQFRVDLRQEYLGKKPAEFAKWAPSS